MRKVILVPVVILKTRTGYNAFSPLLESCTATDKTIDKTLKRMKDALEFHIEGLQLLKQNARSATSELKRSFKDYGTDAIYAQLQVIAA